jgi:endonuclease YncB( thermonuclease family)
MKKSIFKICGQVVLGASAVFALASCGQSSPSKELKLERDFSGKTFLNSGIEEAKLNFTTDGDTSSFKLKNSGMTINVRYLGIDTPESTMGYEKWGKAASKWNANILKSATSIVIEAEGNKAEKDSNGTRYLGFVWYKTDTSDDYTLLNLQTVEEGYSENKIATDSRYHDYFNKAEKIAKDNKRKLFGDEEDVYCPSLIEKVTIKELREHPEKYYDKETQIPHHVEFDAYQISQSGDSFVTFEMGELQEDGTVLTYNLIGGYSSNSIRDIVRKGWLVHIVGYVQPDNTITGAKYVSKERSGEFSYTLNKHYYQELKNLKVLSVDKTNKKISCEYYDAFGEKHNYTLVLKSITNEEMFDSYVGKTINVKGYALDSADAYTITVYNQTNIA